jgi:hypothetical protein
MAFKPSQSSVVSAADATARKQSNDTSQKTMMSLIGIQVFGLHEVEGGN